LLVRVQPGEQERHLTWDNVQAVSSVATSSSDL